VLEGALRVAGIAVTTGSEGSLVADAAADVVGQAVAAAGAVVTELRPAGGEGLEELFRSLTGGPVDGSRQVEEVRA
jgi:ABC-2 type transport system ATP-binding protein